MEKIMQAYKPLSKRLPKEEFSFLDLIHLNHAPYHAQSKEELAHRYFLKEHYPNVVKVCL
jgi:hypothetical protein